MLVRQMKFYGDPIRLLFKCRNKLQKYTKCKCTFSTLNMNWFNFLENPEVWLSAPCGCRRSRGSPFWIFYEDHEDRYWNAEINYKYLFCLNEPKTVTISMFLYLLLKQSLIKQEMIALVAGVGAADGILWRSNQVIIQMQK